MQDVTGTKRHTGGLAGAWDGVGEEAQSYPGQGCSWWRVKLGQSSAEPGGEAGWCLGRKADLAGRECLGIPGRLAR